MLVNMSVVRCSSDAMFRMVSRPMMKRGLLAVDNNDRWCWTVHIYIGNETGDRLGSNFDLRWKSISGGHRLA